MYQAFEKAPDNSSFSSENLEKKCYIFTSLLNLKVFLVPNHFFNPELSYEKPLENMIGWDLSASFFITWLKMHIFIFVLLFRFWRNDFDVKL